MDLTQNKWWLDVVVVIFLVVALLAIKTFNHVVLDVEPPVVEQQYATVQIAGAVETPGVYRLPLPATVWDVVVLAGGTTATYDETLNHLAKPIAHGDKVLVYGRDRLVKPGESKAVFEIVETLDINTATLEDWISVDGIGQVLAERIIQYRFDHGPFLSVDDLSHVSGIGEKKLEVIKKQVVCQLNDPK